MVKMSAFMHDYIVLVVINMKHKWLLKKLVKLVDSGWDEESINNVLIADLDFLLEGN